MTTPRFLLIDEAAAIARTSPNTIRYWLQIGRLRSTKPGRRRLIDEADLLVLLGVGSVQRERGGRAGNRHR